MKEPSFFYGGQAIIEGVMMRGRNSLAMAVRKQDGSIVMQENPVSSIMHRYPILKWPLVRGVVALFEAMIIGMKALSYSAQQVAEEEEEELGPKEMALTIGLALLLTIGLFIVLPALVVQVLQNFIHHHVALNLAEGVVKIAFFLAYVWGISFMKDIQRVFQYHGAEHKAINCLEQGEELTVDNVRKQTRFHKRCGTSFIVIVLLIGILVFSFFGKPPFLLRILYHLAVLPIVAGISYETIRLAGRKNAPRIMDWVSKPGLWTQMITTREPDDSQIEVAIHSLEAVVAKDREADEAVAQLDAQRRRGVEGIAG